MLSIEQLHELSKLLCEGSNTLKKSWFSSNWDQDIRRFKEKCEQLQGNILRYVRNPYQRNQPVQTIDPAKLKELNSTNG